MAEIKARHVVNSWQDPGPRCDWDFMRWPCDAARLLARIEELEQVAEAARAASAEWRHRREYMFSRVSAIDAALAALGGEG